MERGDQDRSRRPEQFIIRVGGHGDLGIVCFIGYLLDQEAVRYQEDGGAHALVQARLCDQQPREGLASTCVLLQNQVGLTPTVVSTVQNLILFRAKTRPLAALQRSVDLSRAGELGTLVRVDLVPTNCHRYHLRLTISVR